MQSNKKRFFQDELESSFNLENKESFLFSGPTDENTDFPDKQIDEMNSSINEGTPLADNETLERLDQLGNNEEEKLRTEDSNQTSNGMTEEQEGNMAETSKLDNIDEDIIIEQTRSSPMKIPDNNLASPQNDDDLQISYIEDESLIRNVQEQGWKRFIGALQVTATSTRPQLRQLKYGSKMKFVCSNYLKKSINGISSNRLKQRKIASNYIRIYDVDEDREVGKVSEDMAKVIYPLLDENVIHFELTMVYCEKRLSIGDSFILQLDAFLTSKLFDKGMKLKLNDKKHKYQSDWGSITIKESDEEKKLRAKTKALIAFFDKLNIRPILDKDVEKIQNSSMNMDDDIIDLEDDEEFESLMSQDFETTPQTQFENDTMNVNQLTNFYNIAQSNDLLTKMPETKPPNSLVKIDLRPYQMQGLSWMLTRENELDKIDSFNKEEYESNDDTMNPLWKRFKWPKDLSWSLDRKPQNPQSNDNSQLFFYANLYTGEFSLDKPVMKSMVKGGILSDEMGLGKTISALSLVLMAPHDSNPSDRSVSKTESDENLEILSSSDTMEIPYAYKTTLIVVPMSLLDQWYEEFKKVNNTATSRCEIYYGGNVSSLKALLTKDKNPPTVVLTTYGIVQNEWSKLSGSNSKIATSGLYSIKFFRIMIDEGHTIRNRVTATSKAVMTLASNRRWVLTGTPIINRLDDLYSLVKFLHLEPWSQISYWNTFVSKPFESKNFGQAFDVVNAITKPVLLRRTKTMKDREGHLLVSLPPKEVIVERLKLSKTQALIYKYLLNRAETSVQQGLARGDLLKSYSTILVHILRLRQTCCDTKLLGERDENDEDLSGSTQFAESSEIKKLINESKETEYKMSEEEILSTISNLKETYPDRSSISNLECSICTTEPINLNGLIFTKCKHPYCQHCLIEYIDYQHKNNLEVKCPNCRENMNKGELFSVEHSNATEEGSEVNFVPYNSSGRSAKLEALVKHLQQLQDKSAGEQVIVFSQFSSFLDILEHEIIEELPKDSIAVYKFDGRLSLKERNVILKQFKEKDFSKQKVLLLSLKAGGVGLNLTCASHAFMMDPWWSPSMEDQAIDRIHRIGQTNHVKVIRFIIQDSIEEKMLRIQERKRTIGETMDADEDERRKRRIEEIKTLFE